MAASTKFAATGATSRLTVADHYFDGDNEEDVIDVDDKDEDNGDDSVVLVGKKPTAHPPPGKKASFKCVLGEVLRVMQDRLVSNTSKNNVTLSSHGTLKVMFADLVKCWGPLIKIATELEYWMEIVGDCGIQGSMTFLQAMRGGESERVWRVRRQAGGPRTLLSASTIRPNG